jgi:deoxyribodipyrimidine photo-lyase
VVAGRLDSVVEPPLLHSPPADLAPAHPTIASTDNFLVRGRTVWLVHPWALRPPPADLPDGYVTIGVYPSEYHRDWPWSEARWRWVDAAMAELTPHRWFLDSESLGAALVDASRVRTVADPHLPEWQADLDPAPALFPLVERPCASFSQWWSRATRGIEQAGGLL